MYNPISTYRIQFHKDFTLANLEQRIDYLAKLGVKTIYASPIFSAVPGSAHGYDALNPLEINREIGTPEDLRRISGKLKSLGMGWLQDIVPNHMAYDVRNPWLYDVLEKGRHSPYAAFFDVTWNDAVAAGHIMAPFLGKSLEEAVAEGELSVELHNGRLKLKYFESSYPLRLRTYETILSAIGPNDALRQWLQQADELQSVEEPQQYSSRFEELVLQLRAIASDPEMERSIQDRISTIGQNNEELFSIANDQVYRLCHWQETDGRINYRRFFTVNGLICLNIQDEAVFAHFHQLIKELVDEGVFQGVRVDHVDGLYDPEVYLHRLRALLGEDCYIVVEKILELHEQIPVGWPIEGATGYEFLGQMNQMLTDPRGADGFTRFYHTIVANNRTVAQQVRDKKAHILYRHMGGELENLFQLLLQQLRPESYAEMRTEDLRTAIAELLLHMPVYRFYGNGLPLSEREQQQLHDTFAQARSSRPDLSAAFGLLEFHLVHRDSDADLNEKKIHLYKRMMQLSGPLMAKGVEDTLMYSYFNALGHNEVGDTPAQWSWTSDELHTAFRERQAEWPLALNASSTHDTKRGEDVRARLQALSSLSKQWIELVKPLLGDAVEQNPDANDTYFLLQTIVASDPFETGSDFADRLDAYLEKALRESKRRSDWATPDIAYENAAKDRARALAAAGSAFRKQAAALQHRVVEFGMLQSSVQLLLKCTAPGVPDIYQGCEGWDLSLVDPDNRRAVDYEQRSGWLRQLEDVDSLDAAQLWEQRRDGRFKFWLTRKLLHLRAASPALFAQGDYVPVLVEGALRAHVFAFARRQGNKVLLVAVPIHTAGLAGTVEALEWGDTLLQLPKGFGTSWSSALNGLQVESTDELPLADLFRPFPLLLLEGSAVEIRERSAGLLLHLTSLPSAFGIGDMGSEAYRFADFLVASRQRLWQMLPINPTEQGQGYSPYSATSTHAGNPLLISPGLLAEEGLLTDEECSAHRLPQTDKVDFDAVASTKKTMLHVAFRRFQENGGSAAFDEFCATEKGWLEPFARYNALKEMHEGKPWYAWEEPYKLQDAIAMKELSTREQDRLQRIRWEQFIFAQQWKRLKQYCNERDIQLIGDLPFYVSYDSADVWNNRHLFRLDASGKRLGMAGVPPDAFSCDGQLWGMPVFYWPKMKEEGYAWWVERLRHNGQLFDLVRLDHFRAFSAFWEVPADAENARHGSWRPGPGADLFHVLQKELGSLPFVAEDLGDIDDEVLQLRDAFGLPGMKVLQFAFGADSAQSTHIPHQYGSNFIAYSGTHDNNTTMGWYRYDCDDATRAALDAYAGRPLDAGEVAGYLCRLALSSVARSAVLPVQDLLELDEAARMNTPASTENNWSWRLLSGQLNRATGRKLRNWTETYGRG
ncbi:MAG: malto-oligosyltrehalose synthase [Chitinophagaceae bacterium]|nr:MAG: malto-oligosyltrehalose synthase [Chitinophagaceae bacterium]